MISKFYTTVVIPFSVCATDSQNAHYTKISEGWNFY